MKRNIEKAKMTDVMLLHDDAVEGKDIVVTRRPNLLSNFKVRLSTTKHKTKIQKNWKKHVCTNKVHVQITIKYTLIYCYVFHQCSSMMRERPWWTIILLLPYTYSPTTIPPPPILLGLVDSLQNSVQNNMLLPLLFLLVILYRDGVISTGRQLLGTQMLLPTHIHQQRPWTHVYRGTLVTITIPHNARLVVWMG